jgi:hypothetical protein
MALALFSRMLPGVVTPITPYHHEATPALFSGSLFWEMAPEADSLFPVPVSHKKLD